MPFGSGNEEEQSRKLFLGGISLDTTDEGMREYFAKYGNITDCVVIRDQQSGRSKGFGFVTFETEEEADECMKERPHTLDGRTIDAKRAVSREESTKPGAHVQVKKIFVGGIQEGCDENTLRQYFGQFGTITACEIPRDKQTDQRKKFGFVTFNDFDVTDKLVAKRMHNICGFDCEVKKALSREEMERAKQQVSSKPPRAGWGSRGSTRGSSRGGSSRGGSRGRMGGGGGGGGDYYGDGYGSYGGGYNDGYGGYGGASGGGGPMRPYQSQRSSGPYGSGYGSGAGGSGYNTGGGYGSYGSGGGYGGYSSGGSNYNGSGQYDGYGGYGSQGHHYYGNSNAGGGKY
ncbi:heterogeneous nuclear ribonucleoprotein A1-like [Clavelina lepadiformis]|uniref:heterogeneous nuclear ribonucleoprotein A1-like n=1 Tax=Clavelina lepadiformis TaxID=159417 RepID=UPI0040435C00